MVGIVLTYNKGLEGNLDLVEKAKTLVDDHDVFRVDEEGKETDVKVGHYYTLKGTDTKVMFLHIVPFGVDRPANLDQLDGYKVLYGKGDEDKTGDHPRFFNWGLKRGTDLGCKTIVHIEDMDKFLKANYKRDITKAADKAERKDLFDEDGYKISTERVLIKVGQLDENDRERWQKFKDKATQRGLNG